MTALLFPWKKLTSCGSGDLKKREDAMNVLTINSGSSSIKFSLYRMGSAEHRVASGNAAGIGHDFGRIRIEYGKGAAPYEKTIDLQDHRTALEEIIGWLQHWEECGDVNAIGHRLVHGGSTYTRPNLIDARLLTALDALIPFAPDHLPHEIDAIRVCERFYPGVKQVACFDTAFHRTMPSVAQRYALPEDVQRHGVLRYGFHGLSYEYILSELQSSEGSSAANGKVIIAHLGNGASMGAFKNGKSMDTTMGFTPAGGLVMSTRSGDLDPGVIVYLLKERGMDAAAINRMVNKDAGLLGVSGSSSDMRDLLLQEAANPRAAAAVELFCYQAKKFLGALSAVLGGLDTLVFTGGIGENAASVRERICSGLSFLGVDIDNYRNLKNERVISREGSAVSVRVTTTNEELMIARHTADIIKKS
jgi:acetate kinase